jgi:hypothetical protein
MTNETIHPEIQPGTFWKTEEGGVREIVYRKDEFIFYVAHLTNGQIDGQGRKTSDVTWDGYTQVADADGTPLEPEATGAYRPFPGTTCLINVPYEYDDCGKYLYHEARVLWCDNMFVAHQQKGGEPAVHKWDEVRCKPLNSTPLKPEGPELISLPIHWKSYPVLIVDDKAEAVASLGRLVTVNMHYYRIVGFRTDNKTAMGCHTHVVYLWHETFTGRVIFATHAVLQKETVQ